MTSGQNAPCFPLQRSSYIIRGVKTFVYLTKRFCFEEHDELCSWPTTKLLFVVVKCIHLSQNEYKGIYIRIYKNMFC